MGAGKARGPWRASAARHPTGFRARWVRRVFSGGKRSSTQSRVAGSERACHQADLDISATLSSAKDGGPVGHNRRHVWRYFQLIQSLSLHRSM